MIFYVHFKYNVTLGECEHKFFIPLDIPIYSLAFILIACIEWGLRTIGFKFLSIGFDSNLIFEASPRRDKVTIGSGGKIKV